MFARFFVAEWLGMGLGVEFCLACITTIYGLSIMIDPQGAAASVAMADVAIEFGRWLAVPLFLKSVLTGAGLYLFHRRHQWARLIRFCGGFVGMIIWLWLLGKYVATGAVVVVGFPCCLMFAYFSIRIMTLALFGERRFVMKHQIR